ncbi:MAG: hypothetical protein NC413_11130 [Muribaculum sp.]|nr:hypothetical protein [Muribaculum sp.]
MEYRRVAGLFVYRKDFTEKVRESIGTWLKSVYADMAEDMLCPHSAGRQIQIEKRIDRN